ncbi:MAG: hypothetical protein E7040_11490 [Lentisphaerae bacterium]|nr:hypothetical protein [Lentisphaerota bacterium]
MKTSSRKNITLCGIKHAGKTSAAKALSALTGMPFADSDDALKELYCKETGTDLTVRAIFQTLGESGFRQLEVRALRDLFSGNECMIIALGGGVLSNPFLTEEDRKNFGFLCCLDVQDEVAYQRIIQNGLPPFLKDKPDPFQALCEMNRSRREMFREYADFIVEIGDAGEATPEKTAEKILAAYEENK